MPILLSLVALLVALAVVVLCWRVVRWLLRVVFPAEASFPVRLGSVVLILILFSRSVETAIGVLSELIRQLLLLPFQVDGQRITQSLHDGDSLVRALNPLMPSVSTLINTLYTIPVFSLLLACLLLPLLVRGLMMLESEATPVWVQRLNRVSSKTWSNTLVLLIFFAGIYLAIASLCTIPSLEVNQPFTADEKNQILAQLDADSLTDDNFAHQFPETLAIPDPVSDLRALLAAADAPIVRACSATAATASTAAASEKAPVVAANDPRVAALRASTEAVARGREIVEQADRNACARLSAYQGLRSAVQAELRDQRQWANGQVNSNDAARLTGRDRSNYINGLTFNYSAVVGQMQTILHACQQETQTEEDLSSSYRAHDFLESLVAPANTVATTSYWPSTTGAGPCSWNPHLIPLRASSGTPHLGIFSLFFGWLEDSDSLALAVICGMVGVGLVGCIVSTFIRQTSQRAIGVPWIIDIFPVVVRGFTAAVVVYLAVEGGLNVVATQTGPANPYVLLCACLVGAVFSEKVWITARDRFFQSAGEQPHAGPQKRIAVPPNAPHTPPPVPPPADAP